MRFNLIDGIRGHLLIGMLIAHLGFQDGLHHLLKFHHYRILLIYDAEFFVLISGMLVGILYTAKMQTLAAFTKFIVGRLKVIYKYYILSAIPFLVMAGYALAIRDKFALILQVMLMQNGGAYSDILPIYFYCFVLLLLLGFVLRKVDSKRVVAASLLIYIAAQFSYKNGFFGSSGAFVIFDIAAWQFLFIASFYVGARYKTVIQMIGSMPVKSYYIWLFILAVGLFVTGQVDLAIPFVPLPDGILPIWARSQLHPYILLRIVLAALLFAMLLMRIEKVTAPVSRVLTWYFDLRILRNVGKYSIQMFTIHVFIMAIYPWASQDWAAWPRILGAVSLIALFIAAPNLYILLKNRQRAT